MPTRSPFDADIKAQLFEQVVTRIPALKGSVSRVAKPCISPNCPACAKGDKHPAILWTFTEADRGAAWICRPNGCP